MNKRMNKKPYFFLIGVALLVIASLAFLGNLPYYKELHKPYPFSGTKTAPIYAYAAGISGFRTVTADFLWMDIVQYIGDPEIMKQKYPELYNKTSNLILMDPNFTYPYLSVSGIYFFELNEQEKALGLIRKGLENNPKYWMLNMYLAAYTYRQKWDTSSDTKDFRKAVQNIENALREEGHPPMLERILGSMYLKLAEIEPQHKKGWMDLAIQHWKNMYIRPTEKLNKEYAERKLKEYGVIP